MTGIGFSFQPFGTGKHNFGYIPDPPEPEKTECKEDCDTCFWKSAEPERDGLYRCNDIYGEGYKEKGGGR